MATRRMCSALWVVRTGTWGGGWGSSQQDDSPAAGITDPVLASTLSWIILHKISQIIQNKSSEGGTKNLNCGKVFYNPS